MIRCCIDVVGGEPWGSYHTIWRVGKHDRTLALGINPRNNFSIEVATGEAADEVVIWRYKRGKKPLGPELLAIAAKLVEGARVSLRANRNLVVDVYT